VTDELKKAQGRRLLEIRSRIGIGQAEMAAKLGVSTSSLQKYEYGKLEIPTEAVCRLFEFYDVNPNGLLLGPEYGPLIGGTDSAALSCAVYDFWEGLLAESRPPVELEAKKPLFKVFMRMATKEGQVPERLMRDSASGLIATKRNAK
jgi:transcriptional regulator with XRE-family HTH domain